MNLRIARSGGVKMKIKNIIDFIIFIVLLILFGLSLYKYGKTDAYLHIAERLVEIQMEHLTKMEVQDE